MEFTKHAATRMQQRALDTQVVHWLNRYGRRVHGKNGDVIVHFDKKSRRRLSASLSREEFVRIEKKLDAYLVEMDGLVITVGYRYKRVRTH